MPLYPHTTFSTVITNPDGSTSGVPIPDPQFTDAEKAVIQLALDGETLFENPVEGDMTAAAGFLITAAEHVAYLGATVGRPLYGTDTQGLSGDLHSLRNKFIGGGDFRTHTARVSGASGDQYYDVADGDFYGFNALQGIASAYNSAKDAMRSEGDPVEDNYSIHFTSILDSGQNMMSDIIDYLGGDGLSLKGKYLGFNPIGEYDEGSVEIAPEDVEVIKGDINTFIGVVDDLINRDNKSLEDSVDYLEKYARGNIVLNMNKDQYFGGRLLDEVATDDLKSLLGDVSTV